MNNLNQDLVEEAAKPWFDEIKPKEIEGYVFKKENGNILVVNPNPRKIEGVKTMHDAIWFTYDPHSVEIGDRVQATYEVVETSYPAHAKATKIKKLESRKPQGAELSEAEAVKKSLETHKQKLKQVHNVMNLMDDSRSSIN
ncbi:DUF3221 domain-containing protein [Metabacillus sp. Hm71]|uniref:DUF3221 domain-containing protein n=1 Tax=Metabacillus sp. Hm71 TaxID=3450743 RepID=UPI003F428CF0